MAIAFDGFPNPLLVPGTYVQYDNSKANQGLAPLPNRVLLIGSRLSTGSVAEGVMKQILRETDGAQFFGVGSQLAWMCEKFKKASRFTEVWAIALDDDGAAVAATKTVTFGGEATSAGTLHFLVHGVRVDVAVAIGDDQDDVAAALAAAIEANEKLMYSGAAVDEVATLTCKHAAAFGNDLDVRLNYFPREDLDMPAGITVAIAAGVNGTTNPDVEDAIAAVNDEHFTKYVMGYTDAANILAVETELDDRWGPMVQQDALAYYGFVDTFSNLTTVADGRNSQFSILIPAAGSKSPAPPWEIAAVTAAVDSNESDPGRSVRTLPLPNILPPAKEDLFRFEDRNLLLQAGLSTLIVDSGGRVVIERLVTSYTETGDGLPDGSYRGINTMHLLAALRFTARARFAQKYPRHKLAADGTDYGPGQPVMTPSLARAEYLTLFEQWQAQAWVQGFTQFAEELVVELDENDPDRLNALLGPNLIKQFFVNAAKIQFS